jgi:hypothetical protein
MKNFTAREAIDKIKAWEEKQAREIEVGDEVKYAYYERDGDEVVVGNGVVVGRSVDSHVCWNIVFDNGDTLICHEDNLQKTGRTFPQISEVLEVLKGE